MKGKRSARIARARPRAWRSAPAASRARRARSASAGGVLTTSAVPRHRRPPVLRVARGRLLAGCAGSAPSPPAVPRASILPAPPAADRSSQRARSAARAGPQRLFHDTAPGRPAPAPRRGQTRLRARAGPWPGARSPNRTARAASSSATTRRPSGSGGGPRRGRAPRPRGSGGCRARRRTRAGVERPDGHAGVEQRDQHDVVEHAAAGKAAAQHPLEHGLPRSGCARRRGPSRPGGRRRGRRRARARAGCRSPGRPARGWRVPAAAPRCPAANHLSAARRRPPATWS